MAPTALAGVNTGSGDPRQTVYSFYNLVGQHRFSEAALLWSESMRAQFPPSTQINDRFRDTQQIQVVQATVLNRNDAAGVATVAVTLVEQKAGASPQGYRLYGTWQLVRGSSGWLLNHPNFG